MEPVTRRSTQLQPLDPVCKPGDSPPSEIRQSGKDVVACVPEHWGTTPLPSSTPTAGRPPLNTKQLHDWPEAALDQQATALRRKLATEASYVDRETDLASLEAVENELRNRQPTKESVKVCGRPADIPIIGGVSEHRWIQTRTKAAGMGAANDERLPGRDGQSSKPGDPTKLTDHTYDTPTHCEEQANIDEACVNRELSIGKDTGRWWPWNQCHTVVDDILKRCPKRE